MGTRNESDCPSHRTSVIPATAPPRVSSSVSTRSCIASRERRAPSAIRMPNSLWWETARASSRLATFAHTISNRSTESAIKIRSG